jgi:hypothetical protein
MRRLSLIAASSTSCLTNSSKRHVGNTECRKLKFIIWIIDLLHDVCTKFYKFPFILSLVIKCKVSEKSQTQFTHPLLRDEESVREETSCMLSGGQKHSVSMEHWTAAHRAFAVEAYFKNNVSMVNTRRLLHLHNNV